MNVTAINDGNVIFRQDFLNVPPSSVERAVKFAFRQTNPTVVGLNVFIVDTPFNRILFDAGAANTPEFNGTGLFESAGLAVANMKRAGIEPETIDSVVLSHGHPDHIAGLTQADGSLVYPNAKLYITRIEHEFWTAPRDTESGFMGTYSPENDILFH